MINKASCQHIKLIASIRLLPKILADFLVDFVFAKFRYRKQLPTIKVSATNFIQTLYNLRIIDERESVGLLVAVKEALENPVELLMDNNPTKALEM